MSYLCPYYLMICMATFKQKIVLVLDKSTERLVDKSDQIAWSKIEPSYVVLQYKNSNRTYRYGSANVIIAQLQDTTDTSLCDVFIDGELDPRVISIGRYGYHYGIIFKNSNEPIYFSENQVIVRQNTSKTVLAYLTQIAESIKDSDSEQEENNERSQISFLSYQLQKLIDAKDNVLTYYLNKKPVQARPLPETLLYPFAVNTSQKKAIKNALTHNISLIQGPPGTGKTQSILNLIANLVCLGKSVGIVSNNNSAVENVKEKLNKEGYGFLIAHLGNSKNRTAFFETGSHSFSPPTEWEQSSKTIKSYTQELRRIDEKINRLFESKEELARCKELLPRVKREQESFHSIFGQPELPAGFEKLRKWSSDRLAEFKTILSYFPERTPLSKLLLSLSLRFKYGKVFSAAHKETGTALSLALDSLIYEKKNAELGSRIQKLEDFIGKSDLKKLLEICADYSAVLFRHSLFERYSKIKDTDFTAQNYTTSKFAAFTARYPVILSTTHSILGCVAQPLDYIIIDESSQVDIITSSLALSACRNVVIVGDEHQLPHIVTDAVKETADKLSKQFGIAAEYDYVRKNIITSLVALYGDSVPKTLLREHYRCNPLIIGFCNHKYYKGELIVMKDDPAEGYDAENHPVRIIRTAPGIHGRDKKNERQIAVIQQEILPRFEGVLQKEIGIISPYRNQANEIAKLVCGDGDMESDTIHKFQGREKRKIIFSTVSNEITEFMDNAQLINVAVSRAIDQFIMVMPHSYELVPGSNIGDLIRYIERWNPAGIIDSQIVSYFDLLQPVHSPSLDDFKKRITGNSRYESENIIERVILDIFSENLAYSGFYLRRGYPLYLITPNKEGLSPREVAFSNHRLAHVDFLIVNRCDNSFVLAIEVDGYNFHSQETQQERDAIKDKVLALNGIELLRLSTRDSQEKEKIRNKLQAITSPNS